MPYSLDLTAQDIDYIGRVVATEVDHHYARSDPKTYRSMVNAVVDTVLNRAAAGRYGKTIKDVIDAPRQFSKITGPKSLNPYGTIDKAPKAPASVQQIVDQHISQRAAGLPSSIGKATDYANPFFSDQQNRTGWIDPMIAAGATKVGRGTSVHYHGNAIGSTPPSYYDVTKPWGFMPPVTPDQLLTVNPIPSPRPENLTAPIAPATGAAGARSMAGFSYGAPLDPVSRAPLPDIPSPAMGARAASGLQGMNSPAAGARAASELQGYVPGSITLPDVPAALSTPPAIAAPMSFPSVANPPAGLSLSLPSTVELQGVHTTPVAPRSMPALPSTVAPPAQVPSSVPAALPSVPAPTVDRAATRSLPSIATPPTGLSINLPSAVPPTSVQTSKAGLIADFPEAPPAPGRQAAIDAAKGAAKGIMAGGLPGAVLGGILGPAMAQIGRNRASNALGIGSRISPFNGVLGAYKNIFGRMGLPSFGSIFGGMAPNYGASPFGVGSGYGAIGSTFGAPAGATAFSRSNPEVSFTSLGNGYVSRSNSKTGVTSVMSADDYDPGTSGRGSSSSGKGSSSSGKGTGGLF